MLGWERWRQIDAEHFGGMIPKALGKAMKEGLIARQPVEVLSLAKEHFDQAMQRSKNLEEQLRDALYRRG